MGIAKCRLKVVSNDEISSRFCGGRVAAPGDGLGRLGCDQGGVGEVPACGEIGACRKLIFAVV